MTIVLLAALLAGQPPGAGEGAAAMIGAGLNQQALAIGFGQPTGSARRAARGVGDRAARATVRPVAARVGVRVPRGARCFDAAGVFAPRRRGGRFFCLRARGQPRA